MARTWKDTNPLSHCQTQSDESASASAAGVTCHHQIPDPSYKLCQTSLSLSARAPGRHSLPSLV